MLFLYRPRQTWMPFRRPRPRTQQDEYNWQLQRQYDATRQVEPYAPDASGPATDDPVARLEKLGQLHDSGVLTDDEFSAAKAKVIGDGGSDAVTNAERATVLVRALRAVLEGDDATIRDLCSDDVRVWAPARSVSSLDELTAELDRRDEAFSDIDLVVRPLDVGGDEACAEWTVAMTHTGPLVLAGGEVVEATGTRVTLNGATVAEFRGDRICAARQYWDELAVFEQIGLLTDDD